MRTRLTMLVAFIWLLAPRGARAQSIVDLLPRSSEDDAWMERDFTPTSATGESRTYREPPPLELVGQLAVRTGDNTLVAPDVTALRDVRLSGKKKSDRLLADLRITFNLRPPPAASSAEKILALSRAAGGAVSLSIGATLEWDVNEWIAVMGRVGGAGVAQFAQIEPLDPAMPLENDQYGYLQGSASGGVLVSSLYLGVNAYAEKASKNTPDELRLLFEEDPYYIKYVAIVALPSSVFVNVTYSGSGDEDNFVIGFGTRFEPFGASKPPPPPAVTPPGNEDRQPTDSGGGPADSEPSAPPPSGEPTQPESTGATQPPQ